MASRLSETRLRFKRLTAAEIDAYLAGGEWARQGRRLRRPGRGRRLRDGAAGLLHRRGRPAALRDPVPARWPGLSGRHESAAALPRRRRRARRRGVVTLDGRPERLLIQRLDDLPGQALGAVVVGPGAPASSRGLAQRFHRSGRGARRGAAAQPAPAAWSRAPAVEVEIAAEARAGKGAVGSAARRRGGAAAPAAPRAGPGEPAARASRPARPSSRTAGRGEAADIAEAAALAVEHALPGGGSDRHRADPRPGRRRRRSRRRRRRCAAQARAVNFAAIDHAARLLRLKGLGGLVVIDLVGRGHDGAGPDRRGQGGVRGRRAGRLHRPDQPVRLLQLVTPRRCRPVRDIMFGPDGAPSPRTVASAAAAGAGTRGQGRRRRAPGGGCAPDVAEAAAPYIGELDGPHRRPVRDS